MNFKSFSDIHWGCSVVMYCIHAHVHARFFLLACFIPTVIIMNGCVRCDHNAKSLQNTNQQTDGTREREWKKSAESIKIYLIFFEWPFFDVFVMWYSRNGRIKIVLIMRGIRETHTTQILTHWLRNGRTEKIGKSKIGTGKTRNQLQVRFILCVRSFSQM